MCLHGKERNKALRRDFKVHEMDRNLLQEEYSRLKAEVEEVEGTMRETLKSMGRP